jgi:hypothetical protein
MLQLPRPGLRLWALPITGDPVGSAADTPGAACFLTTCIAHSAGCCLSRPQLLAALPIVLVLETCAAGA